MFECEEQTRLEANANKASDGRGRPKKSPVELLSDASRLRRHKVFLIEDAHAKLVRAEDELLTEASARLGEDLPPDVKLVKNEMLFEFEKVGTEVAEQKKKLLGMKVQSLVPENCSVVDVHPSANDKKLL